MAYTRASAEAALLRRAGKRMALVGMDSVNMSGTNLDLNDPIGMALLQMGKNVLDTSLVVDADLSSLTTGDILEFLERAELRLLENILGNIDLTDITIGSRRESLGQLADQLEKAITRKRDTIATSYSGYGSIEAGVIKIDTAEKGDDYLTDLFV
jgi:methyl-accepting chemotaxis protein